MTRLPLAGVVLACVAGVAAATPAPCDRYASSAVTTGAVPTVLPELSGLAASRRHPGIYWAHNDSGNAFVLYAMRETGAVVAAFTVRGATAVDPEDVAVGPGAEGDARSCVYVSDTGDNARRRDAVQVVRVVEPEQLRSGDLVAHAIAFGYPDGPHDAEVLFVDPRTAALYVVTKSLTSLGDVYRVDAAPRGPARVTAVRIAGLTASSTFDSLATAGSVHPSGTRVLLRTYGRVWEYRRPGAATLADVLATVPHAVPTTRAPQGEAIAYTADGTGYLLAGEGVGTPIVRIDCSGR